MAFTQVSVTGVVEVQNASPAAGALLTFTLSNEITDGATVVYPQPVTVRADASGNFSVTLNANDDSTTVPTGTYYNVTIEYGNGQTGSLQVAIPKASAPTVNLFSLAELTTPPPTGTPFVTSVNGQSGAVTGLMQSSGTLTNGNLLKSNSSGKATDSGIASSSVGNATSVVSYVGVSNGTDDTSTINSALTALAGTGGTVRGQAGQAYKVSTVAIPGGVTLDMSDCTINQINGTTAPIAQNLAVTATATASDAAMTSGGNVVTTSLASQAVVGQSIIVQNAAGPGTVPFVGLISAVNTGTNQITVTDLDGSAIACTTTVSAASVALYTRDIGPRLVGGNWNKGASYSGSTPLSAHGLVMQHCDYGYFEPQSVLSGGSTDLGHAIDIGNVRHSYARCINATWEGVGIQVKGPVWGLDVPHVAGVVDDDMFAITASDWPSHATTSGNVKGVSVGVIDGICGQSGGGALFKVIAGVGNTVDGVSARRIFGQASTAPVWIGDGAGNASTVGGTYGDIDFGTCAATCSVAAHAIVGIYTPSAGLIRGRIRVGPTQTLKPQAWVYVQGSSTATIDRFDLDLDVEGTVGTNSGCFYQNASTQTINRLNVTGRWNLPTPGSAQDIVHNSAGVINDISLDVQAAMGSSDNGVYVNSGATIGHVRYSGSVTGNVLFGAATGYTGTTYHQVDCTFSGAAIMSLFGGTHYVKMRDPHVTASSQIVNTNGATVRITGRYTGSGTLVHRNASETVSVSGDMGVDLAILTPQDGDICLDASSRTGASGRAIYHSGGTGNGWMNLYTGGKY